MQLTMRKLQNEDDYWRIRAFLREVFMLNGRRELSWQVTRLDYWRWHGMENLGHGRLEEDVFIWETADGRIAAVLNPEDPGHAFLQVHPTLAPPELQEQMLDVAERHLAIPGADGRRKLWVWAHQRDGLRQRILMRRGYVKGRWTEYQRQRSLELPIPEAPPPPGYTVRALGDVDELPARSWASWKGFHPNEPDERYEGWSWYLNLQRLPLYRRDLDIVAIAPSSPRTAEPQLGLSGRDPDIAAIAPGGPGTAEPQLGLSGRDPDIAAVGPGVEIASFCTVWYDDVTRTGCFEPVATVPAHLRLGLGKAVMCEGLRRLKRMGGTLATVAGFTPAANALYASVMSADYELFEAWVKDLQPTP